MAFIGIFRQKNSGGLDGGERQDPTAETPAVNSEAGFEDRGKISPLFHWIFAMRFRKTPPVRRVPPMFVR